MVVWAGGGVGAQRRGVPRCAAAPPRAGEGKVVQKGGRRGVFKGGTDAAFRGVTMAYWRLVRRYHVSLVDETLACIAFCSAGHGVL